MLVRPTVPELAHTGSKACVERMTVRLDDRVVVLERESAPINSDVVYRVIRSWSIGITDDPRPGDEGC